MAEVCVARIHCLHSALSALKCPVFKCGFELLFVSRAELLILSDSMEVGFVSKSFDGVLLLWVLYGGGVVVHWYLRTLVYVVPFVHLFVWLSECLTKGMFE